MAAAVTPGKLSRLTNEDTKGICLKIAFVLGSTVPVLRVQAAAVLRPTNTPNRLAIVETGTPAR
uniref:hypothetical protein n=1 Tax=Amycolatopsis sp. CA-082387 TaxID=3239918 RepID=UPI003F4942E0